MLNNKLKKNSIIKRAILFCIIALTLFSAFFTSFCATGVFAEEQKLSYDTTDVLFDLNDFKDVSEADFDTTPYEQYKDIRLIRFIEYGFNTSDFGLYAYVYNPKNINIDTSSVQNKIQIARSYGADTVLKTQFKKYRLNLISASDSGKFLKFKIAFNSALSTKYESRFYSVSGIELLTAGNNNATEYRVGIVYKSTLNTDGTTTIATDDIPTAKVDVKHTYYRTDYSDKGKGWAQQLSSCYFHLPKSFAFENKSYSSLQAITAEFYNYVTTPIIVTGNYVDYDYMQQYVTYKNQSEIPSDFYAYDFVETEPFSDATRLRKGYSRFSFPYNKFPLLYTEITLTNQHVSPNSLDWVFYDKDLDLSDHTVTQKSYRLYSSTISKHYASVKQLFPNDYMQRLFISEEEYNNGKYSLTGFNYGYNCHTYSRALEPEEQDDVLGYTLKFDNSNGWQKFWGIKSSTSQDLLPIVNISLDDANNLSDEEFSKKYLINMNDVESVKRDVTYYSDEQCYLFRYDCCEYFGDEISIHTPKMATATATNSALMAQESVYLDFDILSFRIAQDGAPFLVETPTKKGFESSNPGKVDDEIEVPNEGDPEDVFNPIEVAPTPKPDCSLFSMRYIWLIIAIASGIIIIIILIKLISLALRIENIWLKILILAVIIAAIGTACYFLYSWLWAKYIAAI